MTNEEKNELIEILKIVQQGNYHINSRVPILNKAIIILIKKILSEELEKGAEND